MPAIKSYMRCLLAALRDVHQRKVIHRDVKPANFLFDPRTGIGTLCDFGLASVSHSLEWYNLFRVLTFILSACLQNRLRRMVNAYIVDGVNSLLTVITSACQMKKKKTFANCKKTHGTSVWVPRKRSVTQKKTRGALHPIYLHASKLIQNTGYARPISKANRAGTRGFRAPEVLFKCNEQTGGTLPKLELLLLFNCVYSDRRLGRRDYLDVFPQRKVPVICI